MKVDKLKNAYTDILTSVGEDISRDGLRDTPERAAKAMQFLTQGYEQTLAQVVNGAIFESDSDEMVIVRDIELYSLCEHHMLPFIGKCHVAYLPRGKVIGLSKIARIVDMYARRLQIQESLTKQIATAVLEVTRGIGVGVIIESQHMCMMMRGVQKQNSSMTTSAMLGTFRSDINTRDFLGAIHDGRARWPTFRDGHQVNQVIEAIWTSHESKSWVNV
ncbi:GTP cyclohydrolase I FolE [Granulosicoccus sp.]|nr:GTP cyclohydrolase I FolE [Granulosicoccus sp.]